MEHRRTNLTQILGWVLTGMLVVCALVVTGLVAFLVVRRCSPWSARMPGSGSPSEYAYALPPSPRILSGSDLAASGGVPPGLLEGSIRAVPLVPELATVVHVAGRARLWLPVFMDEPRVPVRLPVRLADPDRWGEESPFAACSAGRHSLWYMDVGSTLLYGVLVDLDAATARVGVGFVVVKRQDVDRYDVLLQDAEGHTLFAARGRLSALDRAVGRGTLRPEADQTDVRRLYRPRWRLSPKEFVLFSGE